MTAEVKWAQIRERRQHVSEHLGIPLGVDLFSGDVTATLEDMEGVACRYAYWRDTARRLLSEVRGRTI